MRYFSLLLCLTLILLVPAVADTPLPIRTLHVGDSVVWSYMGMTTAATGDPTVADILPLSTHGLLVNAKGAGRTTIVVFDQHGRHAVQVMVIADAGHWRAVASQIQASIGIPTVTARAIRDEVLLEGTVPTPVAAQRAEAIAQVYAPNVKDLVQVTPPPGPPQPNLAAAYTTLINQTWSQQGITAQVMDPQTIALTGTYTPPAPQMLSPSIEPATTDDLLGLTDTGSSPLRPRSGTLAASSRRKSELLQRSSLVNAPDPLARLIASLPRALTVVNLVRIGDRPAQQILVRAKVIDIDRHSLDQLGVQWGSLQLDTSRSGNGYSLQSQPILFGQASSDFYNNPIASNGLLKRAYPLAAALSALITENKARVLSEPSLLVRDGTEGSMLVGGEIPVPVAQNSNGYAGATVSVEYKPYGVRLQVQPTIVAPGTIELTAAPEVSDLDYTNGVSFNGLSIPALTVRSASTTLQMHDGQTLVIGGLYSNTASRRVQRIPLLSQIPVLGEFFKYSETRKQETELLILLSVQIVAPDAPDIQPPAPGSSENPAIGKPDVPGDSFDDFPDLAHLGRPSPGHSQKPVNLPPTTAAGGHP